MKRYLLWLPVTLLLIGCKDDHGRPAQQKADSVSTRVPAAAADSTPEMPEGFRSIHQLQLEAHPDTTADSTRKAPPKP